MFLLYFVFVAISLMFEYNHLTCPFWSVMTIESKGKSILNHKIPQNTVESSILRLQNNYDISKLWIFSEKSHLLKKKQVHVCNIRNIIQLNKLKLETPALKWHKLQFSRILCISFLKEGDQVPVPSENTISKMLFKSRTKTTTMRTQLNSIIYSHNIKDVTFWKCKHYFFEHIVLG